MYLSFIFTLEVSGSQKCSVFGEMCFILKDPMTIHNVSSRDTSFPPVLYTIWLCNFICEDVALRTWWECRLVQPLWKTVWNFLREIKMELPFDPAIPMLGLYPKDPETLIQKNLCTPMFIAAQFTRAKCWKQPKCPSVNEWIKKLWYICTMESTQHKEIKWWLVLLKGYRYFYLWF